MEEPCDWKVIVQPPSKNDLALSLTSNTEKKPPKSAQKVSKPSKEPRQPLLTKEQVESQNPATTQKSSTDRNKDKKRSAAPDHLPSAENLKPCPDLARKEMQDALPKIPPLPSFKSRVGRPVCFTEAKADFENFMSAGPGRSVEIIRQYGTHEEIHIMTDEQHEINAVSSAGSDSNCVKSYSLSEEQDVVDGISRQSEVLPSYPVTSRCMSDGSSSSLDSESEMETEQKTDASASSSLSSAPHLKCTPQPHIVKSTHVASTAKQPIKPKPLIKAHHPNNLSRAFQPCKSRSVSEEKRAWKTPKVKDWSCRAQRRTQEEDEEDDKDDDNELSQEEGNGHEQEYWRACYRAWEEYYNSSSAYYYHSHYSWLAAYRMNAVYMMEMMKR